MVFESEWREGGILNYEEWITFLHSLLVNECNCAVPINGLLALVQLRGLCVA